MGALKKLKSTYITLGYPSEFEDHAQIQAAYQHVSDAAVASNTFLQLKLIAMFDFR